MPRCQPTNRTRRRGDALFALLVATGAAALATPAPLAAQDLGLRGEVAESVLRNQDEDGISTGAIADASRQDPVPTPTSAPAYRPISPGAVPDEPDAATGVDGAQDALPNTSALETPSDGFADMPPPDPQTDRPATPSGQPADDANPSGAADRRTAASLAATAEDDAADTATGEPNRRVRTIDSEDRQPLDPGAERTAAIEGAAPRPDDDPFAPVGISVGTFVLRPSVEEGITATSNADSSVGGKSAVLSETTLRVNATSDWALNSATIDAYGTFRKTLSGQDVDDVRGRVDGTLNLDLDNDWRAIARLGYEAGPESASSPVVIPDTTSEPLHQAIDGSLGIEKDVGKARLALTGAVERDLYGDADLEGGGTLSQKDRNATLYTATLRGGYEISPALTPFVETEIGRRVYDQRADASGYERSANRLGFRAGTEIDLGEKLNGEVSAGWIREALDDERLPAISGASVDADLKWSPERGTIVGLNGTTTLEGSTTPGESGSILYSGRLSLERQIRSDLTANATLGADWRDYAGSNGYDRILSAEAGLTWWLNRYAGITTRARYEKQTSNLQDRDYDAASVFLGLKVQR
jgi:hypothetical protein